MGTIMKELKGKTEELEDNFEEPREFRERFNERRQFSPVLSKVQGGENLEKQVDRLVPVVEDKKDEGVKYSNTIQNYEANYEAVKYENYQSEARQRRDKEMNVTLTPVRRRDESDFIRNENRRINVGTWRNEFSDMGNKKEEYLVNTKREEREDTLPFEQRKRKKLM